MFKQGYFWSNLIKRVIVGQIGANHVNRVKVGQIGLNMSDLVNLRLNGSNEIKVGHIWSYLV